MPGLASPGAVQRRVAGARRRALTSAMARVTASLTLISVVSRITASAAGRKGAALRALSDRLLIERRLYVIDRDRYTCAGGVAPVDMMHAIITADHGAGFARRVSDWFIHTHVRDPDEPQKSGAAERFGTRHPVVLATLALMESHLADPLTLAQLALLAGVSPRHLNRLFLAETGRPAGQVYLHLRLDKADELLRDTGLKIAEVGTLTGFPNPAHFARAMRAHTGHSPRQRRAG